MEGRSLQADDLDVSEDEEDGYDDLEAYLDLLDF